MSAITKERIKLFIKNPLDNGLTRGEQMELARIALASLEAEPVAWTDEEELRDVRKYGFGEIFQCPPDKYADPRRVISLYRELPAPVVPDDWQLVPKKITLEMECALSKADSYEIGWLWALAAAPKYEVQNAKRVQNALNACRAAMLQSGNFRENKNSSTNNFREIAETSTNYPAIPSEVLSAILKVARIRADFDDFDGDRRGIGDCLDEAEQELIVTINKYASQLAAEPIATNDVREQQTAVPPVPEIQDDVAQAIENLKQKLVECNRYNYCADAVKGVEDACHAAMLQAEPVSNSDELPLDYLQGHKDGLEWAAQLAEANHPQTGDWLYDDPIDLARAIRKGPDMPTVQAGNYPVTPDGWISCSERMPEKGQNVLISVNFDSSLVEPLICSARYTGSTFRRGDATIKPGNGIEQATHWMPLPEPPQEMK
ncbi:DUF551 domain-containing protein [Escherichia coli]|nr:hypothetical protein DI389_20310 [Escherichia coli]TPE80763.1 hypothetical protein DI386_15410 [Escherichia coli]